MKEINVKLWRKDNADDWSIEINGLRHHKVSTEITEYLVECALIVADKTASETSTRGPRCRGRTVPTAAKPSKKVLEFAVPQEAVERHLEYWIIGIIESNNEMAALLECIRDSYCALLAGKPVKKDDEILTQLEATLTNAAKAKHAI
jgi:hypothetical protein